MKKLIVLATLAALPAVALADVTISGDIGVSIVNYNHKDGDKTSENAMNRQTGQIVFSGSEDVGNGLKAIWQVANRIDASGDEKNSWGGRDTFVGLQGEFGKVRFGKLSNPANSGYSRQEPFNEISIHGDGVGAVAEQRTANTIRFDSANYAGFEFAASAQLRPESTGHSTSAVAYVNDAGTPADTTDDFADIKLVDAYNAAAPHVWGAGVKYANGPFSANYSYTKLVDTELTLDSDAEASAVAGSNTRVHVVSANYAIGDLTLGLGYANAKVTADDGSFGKQAGWGVTATYALGNLTPKVSYWKEGKLKTEDGDALGSYNVFSVGADYALSKRTSAGVEFQFQGARKDYSDNTKSGKKNTSAVYLTHAF
ncbi:porin [Vogesella sp. GCM10023246]|uniref:Porin n=1 Tax=Vogesella oryzagri TaxID=3160864 RepID=A0ABV1M7Z5_9NEIS